MPPGMSGRLELPGDSTGVTTDYATVQFNSDGTAKAIYNNTSTIGINTSAADKINIYQVGGVLTIENRLWAGNMTGTLCGTNIWWHGASNRTCKIKIYY